MEKEGDEDDEQEEEEVQEEEENSDDDYNQVHIMYLFLGFLRKVEQRILVCGFGNIHNYPYFCTPL